MQLKLHNTLTGQKEAFQPLEEGVVKMYNCGPTVYNSPSIGNMRSYIFADIIRRTFEYFGYKVKQVINITDVGHLVGDGDDGEDKVEKIAKEKGVKATEIAQIYEQEFKDDLEKLNIETEDTEFPRASEHIQEQIEIIKLLEQKEFTYQTSDGIYYDTSKFPDYGKLGNINLTGLKEGARVETNSEKINPTDFALWKFSSDKSRLQEWESPWGTGFPGWHIECSAMSKKYLGQPFDIHTGGIDHIPVHHNNEIAQSEAAYDAPLANYWLHNEFLTIDGQKMSKSLGNIYTLTDLKAKGIHPLSYRYRLLASRYNMPLNFTQESILSAQEGLETIVARYTDLIDTNGEKDNEFIKISEDYIQNDLHTDLVIMTILKYTTEETISKKIVDKIDKILGLNIRNLAEQIHVIPDDILELKKQRDEARKNNDWKKSDEIRDQIEHLGYHVKDLSEKSLIIRSLVGLTKEL